MSKQKLFVIYKIFCETEGLYSLYWDGVLESRDLILQFLNYYQEVPKLIFRPNN